MGTHLSSERRFGILHLTVVGTSGIEWGVVEEAYEGTYLRNIQMITFRTETSAKLGLWST